MAFQVGIIKITGTLDGLSFYHSQFGWLVRRTGGPTRKQFMHSPVFARSRENSLEFKTCSKMASVTRKLVLTETGKTDRTLYHRLMKLMCRLADEDRSSPRRERDPAKGMVTGAGRKLLDEFRVGEGQNLLEVLEKCGFLRKEAADARNIVEQKDIINRIGPPTTAMTLKIFRRNPVYRRNRGRNIRSPVSKVSVFARRGVKLPADS